MIQKQVHDKTFVQNIASFNKTSSTVIQYLVHCNCDSLFLVFSIEARRNLLLFIQLVALSVVK